MRRQLCESIELFTSSFNSIHATVEVIDDRFVNVALVCQVFKPMLKSKRSESANGVIKRYSTCLEAPPTYF